MTKKTDESGFSRREVVFAAGVGAVGAALALAGVGCQTSSEGLPLDPTPDAGSKPPPDAAPPKPDAAPPLTAGQLLEPIETIVVLMMENRSFDHFLGSRRLVEGKAENGLVGGEQNPAPDGSLVASFPLDDYTPADPAHDWDSCHEQWNSGKNDGFVISHAGTSQNEVMGYQVRAQLPVTYAIADGGAVCDRWFASVMGPTWPNRFYLHGATSNGVKTNAPTTNFKSVWDQLDAAGISNKNYYSDFAFASGGFAKLSGLGTIESFLSDAAAGTLPQFSIIDPAFSGAAANDDHPAHDIRLGQAFIATVFGALAKSPQWPSCLFVLTYDEHGGFYDHVSPPTVADPEPGFTQLGFRVCSVVAGPFVKRGTVSTQFDHVSVISTLVTKFGIPQLNARVGITNDLSSCIDPAYFANPQGPPVLPSTKVSWSKIVNAPVDDEEIHREMKDHVPPHLDRSGDSLGIAKRWLEEGQRLGVVEIVE